MHSLSSKIDEEQMRREEEEEDEDINEVNRGASLFVAIVCLSICLSVYFSNFTGTHFTIVLAKNEDNHYLLTIHTYLLGPSWDLYRLGYKKDTRIDKFGIENSKKNGACHGGSNE